MRLRRAHARVVDQNINGSHFSFSMGYRRLDAGMVGHIQRHHMRGSASRFNLRTQLFQLVEPAAGQHHGGTGTAERSCKLSAKTARSAGHERDTARKINAVRH